MRIAIRALHNQRIQLAIAKDLGHANPLAMKKEQKGQDEFTDDVAC